MRNDRVKGVKVRGKESSSSRVYQLERGKEKKDRPKLPRVPSRVLAQRRNGVHADLFRYPLSSWKSAACP